MMEETDMNSKTSYILGTVTIVGIVGFTIYAIKKSKDAKKAEEEEITLDEARAIVKGRAIDADAEEVDEDEDDDDEEEESFDVGERIHDFDDEDEEEEEEIKPRKIVAKTKAEHIKALDDEYEEEEEEEDFPIEMTYNQTVKKGDEELRYEPNSIEAIRQFIGMELSEFNRNGDIFQTMERLYDIPFIPQNEGDEMLLSQLIDYRVQFFGFNSKWTKSISMADVITHYARHTNFNYGESPGYWIGYFLEFNELDVTIPTHKIDQTIKELNSHTYYNEERASFGLFGISREAMDHALKVAGRGVTNEVSYEIEFNEFLKSCL